MSLSGNVRCSNALARLFGSHILSRFPLIWNMLLTLFLLCLKAALARTNALILAQKEKKPAPPKKLRGKKAAEVASALA